MSPPREFQPGSESWPTQGSGALEELKYTRYVSNSLSIGGEQERQPLIGYSNQPLGQGSGAEESRSPALGAGGGGSESAVAYRGIARDAGICSHLLEVAVKISGFESQFCHQPFYLDLMAVNLFTSKRFLILEMEIVWD